MNPSAHQIRTDRTYAFDDERLTQAARIGSFETNTAVWASATPRVRAVTQSPLSSTVSALLPSAQEAGHRAGLSAGKYIAYGAKTLGKMDEAYAVGQHLVQGHDAETVSAGAKASGGLAGAYGGAKALGSLGAVYGGVAGAKAGAIIGAGFGALAGGKAAEALADTLTGGPTPDKLGPPLTLPSHLRLEPTIVTAEGDRYALVNVQDRYTWFGMHENPTLPNRYIEVVRGAKVAELTRSYLDAAGFAGQAERHDAALAEQQRSALREQFRRSETQDTNSLGPDGQPWGTPTRTAPNATGEWARSPQPGELLHTSRIHSGAGVETRVVRAVDQARWAVTREQVHENGQLVRTLEPLSGQGWALDRASGQMRPFRMHPDHAAGSRMPPPLHSLGGLSDEALLERHRRSAQAMAECLQRVRAQTVALDASRSASHVSEEAQALEQRFHRAGGDWCGVRREMQQRGMTLPQAEAQAHQPSEQQRVQTQTQTQPQALATEAQPQQQAPALSLAR